MAKLVYSVISSVDGYTADKNGNFDWAMPDEEVHSFVNGLERPIGTYLYGRRMYDIMLFWETAHTLENPPGFIEDYTRIWQSADKIVYSRTLEAPSTARTSIRSAFDPDEVARLKERSERDISIGGPQLAAQAIAAGLVDEFHLFVFPIVIGGGTRMWPKGSRFALELIGERRFASGVVYLHYRAQV